jgi:putative hemolysin
VSLTTSLLKSNYTKRFYINTGNFFKPQFKTKLADSKNEIKAAQKLRYEVFFEDRKKKKIISISSFKRDTDR